MYSRVLGTGSALPKRIVTNGEFAAMLARDGIETSDEWIRTRTGITIFTSKRTTNISIY